MQEIHRGPYNHPISGSIIHALLFKNENAVGNLYPLGFGPPIRREMLALVFMIVRCALDQYAKTGIKATINLDRKSYLQVFNHLLFNIDRMHEDAVGQPILSAYLTDLYVLAEQTNADAG